MAEQDIGRVQDGQMVQLKARALPFKTFETKVSRIAPAAEPDELQSTVNVVCRLDADEQSLKPGMTGYARIYTGRCSLGEFTVNRILRYVRTEFWW
ncbi:MAG: efflux RND transporter periplasmic adaptor subunit [Candidatus Marinimicrobia bacterium]|nr:efflux RND transporter periplasmic adaptor subunit [Candidatus Neomarinimicrobiota bacterium]